MGHAIAWFWAGFRLEQITVTGRGRATTGLVRLEHVEVHTPDQARKVLIGLLAGREAEYKWCDITGQFPDDTASSADLDAYRKFRAHYRRRKLLTTQPIDAQLRTAARRLVTAHWRRIERLAEQLAHRGAIKL